MELSELKGAVDDLRKAATEVADAKSSLKTLEKRLEDVEVKTNRQSLDDISAVLHGDGWAGGGSWDQREHAKAFTQWLRNPRDMEMRAHLQSYERKTASGLTDAAGGALVPEILVSQIIKQVKDGSAMRSVARVLSVSSGDVKFPIRKNNADSAWVGELDTRLATSEPTLIERKPTVGTVYSYIAASEELISDSAFSVSEWFVEAVADELTKAEGAAFLSGNGTNRPSGILNTAPESAGDDESPARTSTAIQYFPTGASGAFQTLSTSSPTAYPDDVLYDAIYGLKSDYRRNAVWMMASTTAGAVRKMRDADGRSLWVDPISAGQPARLCGYPVVIDEAVPAIGANTNSILFGDFRRGYGIFDVGGLRITLDDNITTPGRLKWYVRKRVGGVVLDHNAIKSIKFAAS